MSETVPRFSVVIPTLGNHEVLWETLDALAARGLDRTEVIVVYNGWPEGWAAFQARCRSRFPAAALVRTPDAYGIARSNNLGYRESRGEYVAFLHDDVLIDEPGWQSALAGVLDRHADVGLAGGSEPKAIDRPRESLGEVEAGVPECDWSPTISMARRRDLDAGALFDEFYLAGLEDKDWALELRRRGLRTVCRRLRHRHVGTLGSYELFLRDPRMLDYYSKEGVRERYFLRKNRDVLAPAYVTAGERKWRRRDRNWRKTWWMKLYLRSWRGRAWGALRGLLPGRRPA